MKNEKYELLVTFREKVGIMSSVEKKGKKALSHVSCRWTKLEFDLQFLCAHRHLHDKKLVIFTGDLIS